MNSPALDSVLPPAPFTSVDMAKPVEVVLVIRKVPCTTFAEALECAEELQVARAFARKVAGEFNISFRCEERT